MYKCTSFLWKSDIVGQPTIEDQFNTYFYDLDIYLFDTQVVSNSYVSKSGETVYQDIMYVWYREG